MRTGRALRWRRPCAAWVQHLRRRRRTDEGVGHRGQRVRRWGGGARTVAAGSAGAGPPAPGKHAEPSRGRRGRDIAGRPARRAGRLRCVPRLQRDLPRRRALLLRGAGERGDGGQRRRHAQRNRGHPGCRRPAGLHLQHRHHRWDARRRASRRAVDSRGSPARTVQEEQVGGGGIGARGSCPRAGGGDREPHLPGGRGRRQADSDRRGHPRLPRWPHPCLRRHGHERGRRRRRRAGPPARVRARAARRAVHPGPCESHHARVPRGAGDDRGPQGAADPVAAPARAGPRARRRPRGRSNPRPPAAHPPGRRAHRAGDHVRQLFPGPARAGVAAAAGARGAGQSRALVRGARPGWTERRFVIGSESRVGHAALDLVIDRSQAWFAGEQFADGFWWAELESNATMEAEYLLLTHFLGARDEERWRGVAQDIRNYQRDDGSWAMYHGAPGDLSTTVECYFALKLAGDPADAPHLSRAREFIRARGGIGRARTFTRIWLALFGQWSWDELPAMPPELVLLPPSAPFSIYQFSSWARGTIVPLLLLMDDRPVRAVPEAARLDELHVASVDPRAPRDALDRLFFGLDRVLRWYNRLAIRPLRQRARKAAERWIVAHQEADGSWGGIQPPWVYSLMALHTLGYSLEHPVIRKGLEGMHGRWTLRRDDGSLRVQACLSPVWDTGLALLALLESGARPSDVMVQRAARWLLQEEIRVPGDWSVHVPGVEPSGWAFEFENDLYPDVDDSAVVMLALHKAGALDPETRKRALAWVLAMQSRNGGWAAFDKDNTSRLPALLPFSDFGEMI